MKSGKRVWIAKKLLKPDLHDWTDLSEEMHNDSSLSECTCSSGSHFDETEEGDYAPKCGLNERTIIFDPFCDLRGGAGGAHTTKRKRKINELVQMLDAWISDFKHEEVEEADEQLEDLMKDMEKMVEPGRMRSLASKASPQR